MPGSEHPTASDRWRDYLHRFHADRPAITESLLAGSTACGLGSPYDWLVSGVGRMVDDTVCLDVGCGSAPMHPRLPTGRFVGVDVARAELHAATALGRRPVLQASATALPLGDDSVDVLVASMSLMVMEPVEQAVAEMARVARPGAPVGIILPTGWPVRPRDAVLVLALAASLRGLPSPGQVIDLRLPRLLRAAGFAVVANQARRFAWSLADERDAAVLVDSLYLPGYPPSRTAAAVAALTRLAGPGVQFPVPIRRVLARRVPGRPAPAPRRTRARGVPPSRRTGSPCGADRIDR